MPERLRIATAAGTFDAIAEGPAGGRTVLLLHGFPESSAEWHDQLAALAAHGCRAVAFDQRGYSPGVRPTDPAAYCRDLLASDALGVLDALGWPTADVVGHDWGASVAWDLAIVAPERIRTLTAISVPHPDAISDAMVRDPQQPGRVDYMRFMRREDAARLLLADEALRLHGLYGGHVPADRVAAHLALLSAPGALDAALHWYRATHHGGPSGPVNVPTLFVWGTEEVAFGPYSARAVADHVTGPYRFEVLDGISHWVPEQAPDALNQRLLAHLDAFPV